MMEVQRSDLEKVGDALRHAVAHHRARDEMNAHLHLAGEVRFSPLTSELVSAAERLDRLLSPGSAGGE